jgi:hypothetical protein
MNLELLSKSWNYYVNCDLLHLTMPLSLAYLYFRPSRLLACSLVSLHQKFRNVYNILVICTGTLDRVATPFSKITNKFYDIIVDAALSYDNSMLQSWCDWCLLIMQLSFVFELHISKMDFYKRLFDTGVICGGIYQITVSLNGKYTYNHSGNCVINRLIKQISPLIWTAYETKSYDQRDLKVANLRNLNFEVIFVVIRLKNILMRLKLSEGGTLVSMPVYLQVFS